MKRFLLFVIYYLSTWTANAQEGTWYGKLDIQGTILPVVFHFSDDESQGQVHRPERVNQCTCRFEPVSL